MRLLKIISQMRRDFTGEYECEGCKVIKEVRGYDDRNFHDNVIPKMKCTECGKSSIDFGSEVQHIKTKYPEGMQV